MFFPACAHAVANGECVCVTPPISGNARYSAACVGVSLEGFSSPSTRLPSAMDTITMSSALRLSYGTPLGLMANTPAARSASDTLPHV